MWWERVQALGPGAEVLVEPNQADGFEGGVFQVVAVEPPSHGRGGIAASVAVIGRRIQQRRRTSHETLGRVDDRSD